MLCQDMLCCVLLCLGADHYHYPMQMEAVLCCAEDRSSEDDVYEEELIRSDQIGLERLEGLLWRSSRRFISFIVALQESIRKNISLFN